LIEAGRIDAGVTVGTEEGGLAGGVLTAITGGFEGVKVDGFAVTGVEMGVAAGVGGGAKTVGAGGVGDGGLMTRGGFTTDDVPGSVATGV
jgi:hypothetical protein